MVTLQWSPRVAAGLMIPLALSCAAVEPSAPAPATDSVAPADTPPSVTGDLSTAPDLALADTPTTAEVADSATFEVGGACGSDGDCAAGRCHPVLGTCVACLETADCPKGLGCKALSCVVVVPCASTKDCPKGEVCNTLAGYCVGCVADTECAAGQFCDKALGACVAQVCTPGQEKCNGPAAVDTCKPNGSGWSSSACDDGQPCTTDACASDEQGCLSTVTVGATCSDGDACTSGDHCEGAKCKPSGVIDCDDQSDCTADLCFPASGCAHESITSPCDDLNPCTLDDACANGVCKGPKANTCDDGTVCTKDSCDPAAGCKNLAIPGSCDDGQPCTTQDTCAAGKCAGQPKSCDDGTVCTEDACAPSGSCTNTPVPGTCEDGNVCTTNDACAEGTCVGGPALDCNDGTPCTSDSCDALAGCVNVTLAGQKCDDGNVCSVGDVCGLGKCLPGKSTLNCDDGKPCTFDICDKEKACVHALTGGPGCCITATDCDDKNDCSIDFCTTDGVCTHTPVGVGPCSDGDACTLGDSCAGETCVGTPKSCDDTNPCTSDACTPGGQCSHVAVSGACATGTCFQGACCTPKCALGDGGAKECGDDGCGGTCGTCAAGTTCGLAGLCVAGLAACDGPCTGTTTDALVCALDACQASAFGGLTVTSPTGSELFGTVPAVTAIARLGEPTNGLAPRRGGSYVVLSTGQAVGTDKDVALPNTTPTPSPTALDPLAPNATMYDAVTLTLTLTAPAGATGLAVRYVYLSKELDLVGNWGKDPLIMWHTGSITTGGVAQAVDVGGCKKATKFDLKAADGTGLCYVGYTSAFIDTCAAPALDVAGTGFGCAGPFQYGLSTGWLETRVVAVPGEAVTLAFHLHDAGDALRDSTVVVDGVEWLTGDVVAGTGAML